MAYAEHTAVASSEEAQSGLLHLSHTPDPLDWASPWARMGHRGTQASLSLPAIYSLPEEAAHDSAFNVAPLPVCIYIIISLINSCREDG